MAQPEEFNILTSAQFKMDIENLPDVTYWIQSTQLPSVTLEGGQLPTPNRDILVPGHKLEFDQLTVTFLVDQDLKNYSELYHWMVRIAAEDRLDDMTSDLTLHFLTGQMNISQTVRFVGAHPVTLTEVAVQSDDSDAAQVIGTAIFSYQYFTFDNNEFPYQVG